MNWEFCIFYLIAGGLILFCLGCLGMALTNLVEGDRDNE